MKIYNFLHKHNFLNVYKFAEICIYTALFNAVLIMAFSARYIAGIQSASTTMIQLIACSMFAGAGLFGSALALICTAKIEGKKGN